MCNKDNKNPDCDCCGKDIRHWLNANGDRAFVVVLSGKELTEALTDYAVKGVDLPPCRISADAKIKVNDDGELQAVIDVTWWPDEPEGPQGVA